MEHSIVLVTVTTFGLGYAAAQLGVENKRQVFTPLELDMNAPDRKPRGRPS